ncbi:MAG: hypothetical protein DWI01_00730 [Planctomycetota bacterium]|nr:MAG: hypothetical protein DWI01_00730 [Planctomycetota bacterium]
MVSPARSLAGSLEITSPPLDAAGASIAQAGQAATGPARREMPHLRCLSGKQGDLGGVCRSR